ncbi:MAG: LacI family DNA-binding transcriptional regulator [Anaerolineae bacterium]|jgi:LacI family transcriptional regulator
MASTLQEIADRLDISAATVSRVLNGKPGVSQKTRQRVLEIARELNFTPNPAAQSLVTSKTYAVAFVIKRWLVRVDNPFYDRIMMGVEQELEKHGYHLVAITIDETQHTPLRLPPGLDKRRLDGLIIAGCELSDGMMTTLISLGVPTVLVGNTLRHSSVDAVTSANQDGGFTATTHLIEHGHRQIAFLCGPQEWSPVRERLQGYREAMREHSLPENIIYCPDLEIETGRDALRKALNENPNISAVFATSDPIAIGAMRAAQELGRTVPDDLAIIGFDNIPWAENTQPPLTTLYIHKGEMGKMAARRLLELFDARPQPPLTIRVGNELVIRQSCGCSYPASNGDDGHSTAN